MEFFKPNVDPSKRFIAIFEVSQYESVANPLCYSLMDYETIESHFKNSEALDDFYSNISYIDWCMVICLYHTMDKKEVRRRILKTHRPQNSEELFELIRLAADSVGVTINTHEIKVNQSYFFNEIKNEIKNDLIKERDLFLQTLMDFHEADWSEPFKELESIKEHILKKATIDKGETPGYIIGNFLQKYIETQNDLYRVAKDFGEQLLKTNLKISTELIPHILSPYLLEFPFYFKFECFEVKTSFAYVSYEESNLKVLTLVCPLIHEGYWDSKYLFMNVNIDNNYSIEESLKETSKFLYDQDIVHLSDLKVLKDLVFFVLKSLIYINSEEPRITKEVGVVSKKKNKAKLRSYFKHNNPFTVINLNYSFHGRIYSKEETSVSGHFRWQPCGPRLSQVKLIWIEEHARHFNAIKLRDLDLL